MDIEDPEILFLQDLLRDQTLEQIKIKNLRLINDGPLYEKIIQALNFAESDQYESNDDLTSMYHMIIRVKLIMNIGII